MSTNSEYLTITFTHLLFQYVIIISHMFKKRCRSDRERATSCATSFYPYKSCKFESRA